MRKNGSKLKKVLMAILLILLAAAAAYTGARYFNLIETVRGDGAPSKKVTLNSSLLIETGMSQSEVERIFGTKGIKTESGSVRYVSEETVGTGQPAVQADVEFDGYTVSKMTYLDLRQSTVTGDVGVMGDISRVDSLAVGSIEKAVGVPTSMYRIYRTDEGSDILEVHFGFTDPYASFNEAWRGEYVVICDMDSGELDCRNYVGYDGSDPLLTDTLEGRPLSNQYDSYTDYLNDKFAYDRGMLMLNHYSIGDARRIFGDGIVGYGEEHGTLLYSLDSEEKLSDGQPLYRMSFGFDRSNYFRLYSFVNMRLFNKLYTLKDSSVGAVTKGMSYNEVRSLMGVLPTALYVDENVFTVCYGRYLGTPSMEEQFELVVRFDTKTGYALNVYDNTARSEMLLGGAADTTDGGTEN